MRKGFAVLLVLFLLLPVLAAGKPPTNAQPPIIQVDPCTPATEKLFWSFSDAFVDESACGNNGDYGGGSASIVTNSGGKALYLEGTARGFVKRENFASFPTTALTVMFWMKSDQIWNSPTRSDGAGLVSYAVRRGPETIANDDANEFLIFYYPMGRSMRVYVDQNGGDDYVTHAIPLLGLFDNRWHHVAVTWQGSDGVTIVYVDGIEAGRDTLRVGASLQGDGTLVLGQDQDRLGGGFDARQAFRGLLDEVRIENQVKSARTITREFNQNGRCDEGDWVTSQWFNNRNQVVSDASRAAVSNVAWGCCAQPNECVSSDNACYSLGRVDSPVNVRGQRPEGNLICKSNDWYMCTPSMERQTLEIGLANNPQRYTCRNQRWALIPPDADSDGVVDARDRCPGTPAGGIVDEANGCLVGDLRGGDGEELPTGGFPDGCVNLKDIWYLPTSLRIQQAYQTEPLKSKLISNINLWC